MQRPIKWVPRDVERNKKEIEEIEIEIENDTKDKTLIKCYT